ncbi:MAG TPA: MFS transporter [Solirubrobacterales bacterium]|nr:MFS transporter [Solirubrobacterales bacterium]
METSGHTNKNLVLAAMIFAVSMTFIDMTIVAIAVPSLQNDLSLSSTGVQWIINGYLLSLSALFALGGRIADIAGHRSMVVLGVIVFATASALCGATPTIFWVNIPVAIIALVLTAIAKPENAKHPAALVCGGMGLSVLGLQQSSVWGWGNPITWICIAAGIAILVAFVLYELRIENPLIQVRIFADRAFAADNAILFLLMIPFIPLFFFASMYAQISLGESASETGLYLLIFFAGFATASQWGGRMLDKAGARAPVVLGCAVATVGFALWAHSLPDLSVSSQWYYIVLAGAGVGLVLSPANTDALNRVPASRYGEATGITQTVRNFGSSLGMAVLGTVLILQNKSNLESTATAHGVPKAAVDEIADAISQGSGAGEAPAHVSGALAKVVDNIPHDFALATQTVFYAMAGVMALAFVVAVATMQPGKVEEQVAEAEPAS